MHEDTMAKSVPPQQATSQPPWISTRTLQFIGQMNAGRQRGDDNSKLKLLNKQIQRSARANIHKWLDETIEKDGWRVIRSSRSFRKKKSFAQGPLRDLNGDLVDATRKADAMADYLERIQWNLPPTPGPPPRIDSQDGYLSIDTNDISMGEVKSVITNLRVQRAPGNGGVLSELWQSLWRDDRTMEIIRDLCNTCWRRKTFPQGAETSIVPMFKKGCASRPRNYRSISLLAMRYKILAIIRLRNCKIGDAEEALRESQTDSDPNVTRTTPSFWHGA